MGRAPDGERWLIALPGGKRVNVKMSNIKPAGDLDTEIVQREDTSAVPLRGPEDPPSRVMIEVINLISVVRNLCPSQVSSSVVRNLCPSQRDDG